MNTEPSESAERRAKLALATKDEELVAKVFYECLNENTKPPEIRPALALAQFSALLHNVSFRAERQTKRLVWFTIVLAVLTFALLAFTVVLYKDTHELVEHERQQKNAREF